MSLPDDIVKNFETLRMKRILFDHLAQEIIDYVAPHFDDVVFTRVPGWKKTQHIFDSTASYGWFVLSQFIQGSVLNQATKWFGLKSKNPDLNQNQNVATWYADATNRALGVMRSSAFYGCAGQSINSWIGFGNGPVLIEDVPQVREGLARIRYTSIPFGKYVMAEGVDGKIDCVIRTVKMTAINAKRMFDKEKGESTGNLGVSDRIERAAEKEPFLEFEFLHSIHPRDVYNANQKTKGKTARDMPVASCWVEKEKKRLVRESGYRRFPVAVARYDLLSGEVFGRGPAHLALPDARSLNRADEMELVQWEREIDRPLKIRRNTVIGGIVDARPAGRTTVTDINGIGDLFDHKTNWQADDLMRKRKEQAILRVFHVNEILNLLAREKPEMTAFEVNARLNLLQQILGPVFGRLESDFLSVIVEVTLENMAYAGLLLDPPDELKVTGEGYDIVYEGPLARAQRNTEITAIQQSIADVSGIAQFDQEAVQMVDFKKATRKLFEIRGTQDLVLSEREFEKKLEVLQQQQQAQQMMAAGAQTAESLGKVAPFVKLAREQTGATPPAAAA